MMMTVMLKIMTKVMIVMMMVMMMMMMMVMMMIRMMLGIPIMMTLMSGCNLVLKHFCRAGQAAPKVYLPRQHFHLPHHSV